MSTVLAPAELRSDGRARAATSRDTAISLKGLTKRFAVRREWAEVLRHPRRTDYTTAVNRVSCEIRAGEFFGLLGPNGAGKTTIFKMLLTSTIPDGGTALVHGHDVVRSAARVRRLVGCVLANDRSLYWRLSALENLRLYAALYNLHGAEARHRVDELLRLVDLHDAGTKLVATFSSGMKQRLLIARALLPRPKVLLLDEPTRSLDPLSARNFRSFLRSEIAGEQGSTVMVATHSSEEAIELCDRVGVLNNGRLLAVGTTDELARRFGGQLFCVWTKNPDHAAFATLASQGRVAGVTMSPAEADGWSCVRMAIPGDLDQAKRVLELLTAAGVGIARFERESLSLADLIERVVASREEA
jgi:ABC-type multidrug transport system ATPase subunit